jgi:hypothetical protein
MSFGALFTVSGAMAKASYDASSVYILGLSNLNKARLVLEVQVVQAMEKSAWG